MGVFRRGNRFGRCGFEGPKLGCLIEQSGYVHDGHGAVSDCFALLEVLVGVGAERRKRFCGTSRDVESSRVRIFAEQGLFDMKRYSFLSLI